MTPARFTEVFRAAITLEGAGDPIRWVARSPLVRAGHSRVFEPEQTDGERHCISGTPEEAIGKLIAAAVVTSREEMEAARAKLKAAEERWRRIEAAAAEIEMAPIDQCRKVTP